MKNLILTALLCVLPIKTLFATTQSDVNGGTPAPSDASVVKGVTTVIVQKSLKQISNQNVLFLKSTAGSAAVTLGGNPDGIITRAIFHLQYTFSPALIPGESHLKVIVNDETVSVIPVTRENTGRNITQDVPIDTRLLADINRIRFDFVGHYTHDREDPSHNSLWMEISGASQLELTVQKLETINNLALLPEPFFYPKDFKSKLSLQFVFSSAPNKSTLNAAGIVSSWFGKLAAWRGARFPVQFDSAQGGNAIVFATASDRPSFLGQYPKIEGPAIEMITNPIDGHSKLLLVTGRDGNDLKVAAQALVLGNAALSGSKVTISNVKVESARQPYDAPNWVRLDRPVKLGELVSYPQELQVAGRRPEDIRVSLRVPVDLFTWRSRGVPVDLKYRYTPDTCANDLRLRLSINDELVKSFSLPPSGEAEKDHISLSGIDDGLSSAAQKFWLPAFKLAARNELQFNFTTGYPKESNCKDSVSENVRSMIDADSQLDFTGFSHYAEMPNLNFFATSGFPFTKYADLSQTVVVMPERPTTYDIETMLILLGRMGESTGYPATQFKVAGSDDEALLKNADLLVIGASLKQGLLAGWTEDLPVDIKDTEIRISQPKHSRKSLYNWFNFGAGSDSSVLAEQKISGNGPLSAILGFESPLSSNRSVVAIVATQSQQLPHVLYMLEDSRLTKDVQGSVVLFHPNKVEGFLVGQTYFTGELPLLTSTRILFANHPILLAIMAVLALLIFAFALSRALKLLVDRRLGEEN